MKNTSRLLLILSFIWAFTILALGGWWLYLLMSLGERLEKLGHVFGDEFQKHFRDGPDLLNLVLWEGSTFLIVLALLSVSMLVLYLKDQQKTKSLQDFFASLTHELKTPLASIRLQAEVIEAESPPENPRLRELVTRMVEDVGQLEMQMDKILQLSRLERGGSFNLAPVELLDYWHDLLRRHPQSYEITIENETEDSTVLADEFALQLIFKNLIENTQHHAPHTQRLTLRLKSDGPWIVLTYSDEGVFNGDPDALGTMFYKHASTQGTGIGLYLIKKSLEAMGGKFAIKLGPPIGFQLSFLKAEETSSHG